jgi:hypothetical protein
MRLKMNQTTQQTDETTEEEFNPKLRKQSYLEICVDDALYNAPYEVMIQYNKGSEFAGWGCERPDSRLVSYQRLWEYYVNMETYRDALAYDIETTKGTTHEEVH